MQGKSDGSEAVPMVRETSARSCEWMVEVDLGSHGLYLLFTNEDPSYHPNQAISRRGPGEIRRVNNIGNVNVNDTQELQEPRKRTNRTHQKASRQSRSEVHDNLIRAGHPGLRGR